MCERPPPPTSCVPAAAGPGWLQGCGSGPHQGAGTADSPRAPQTQCRLRTQGARPDQSKSQRKHFWTAIISEVWYAHGQHTSSHMLIWSCHCVMVVATLLFTALPLSLRRPGDDSQPPCPHAVTAASCHTAAQVRPTALALQLLLAVHPKTSASIMLGVRTFLFLVWSGSYLMKLTSCLKRALWGLGIR